MSYLSNLRDSINKGHIKYRPSEKTVRLQSSQTKQAPTADRGQIDFYNYGGKKSKETKWEELTNLHRSGKDSKGKNDNKERDNWKRVADEIGIDNIDSEEKVLRMIDHVMGARSYTKEADPAPDRRAEPLLPRGEGAPRFYEPMPKAPGMSEGSDRNGLSDANMAAIRGGDDLNEWYQTKFVPHLEADANATASEIGDDSRYFLDKFVFDPPKLGSVKDLFDRYKGEIEDLD